MTRHDSRKEGYVSGLMRGLLEREGKNVTEVAELVGMSRPSLSQVLNGAAGLSIPLALKLESAFGVDARTILVGQLYEDIQREIDRQKKRR